MERFGVLKKKCVNNQCLWCTNSYIPLLLQVSVQLLPNIPDQCSPPTVWTQQTPHWAAESGWQDSSYLKQYTSESFWVLSQRAGAYFSLLQGVGRHLCRRNDSPGWPLKNCVYVQSHEAHHQALSSGKARQMRRFSTHVQNCSQNLQDFSWNRGWHLKTVQSSCFWCKSSQTAKCKMGQT